MGRGAPSRVQTCRRAERFGCPSDTVRPMHLVVDGMNVIGSRPDGWWRDREAASRRLVDRCERLVRADGAEVTVVFDGHPRDDPSEEEHTGVRVLYATRRGPDAADDSIVELVASAERSEELRVVTSDRELRHRVETLGATVGGATELLDRLDALGRRIDRPPVPPDSVARAAGVRVVMDSLSAELAGLLRVLDGAPTIVVNSSHGEMRRRFTIAHELGHLSLHGGREGSQMFVDRDFVFRRGQKAAAGSGPRRNSGEHVCGRTPDAERLAGKGMSAKRTSTPLAVPPSAMTPLSAWRASTV